MNRVLSNSFLALLLSLFLLFSKSSNGQSCGCDHILKTNPDGGIYFTNGNGMTVLPGEKVCIQGGYYPYISLVGLVGTAAQPITITNCGGQVICGSGPSYCYRILNSRYFKFTGTGTSGIFYGFKSYWAGGFTGAGMSVRDSSSDFEVDHLETMNCANGFLCKIDPADCSPGTYSTGWLIKNISYHDNYVHNTVGEGMYLINTANTQDVLNCNNQTITIEPVKADNVKVYNNIIDSTGWDGIQLAATTNAEIYNNKVTNYGRTNMGSQQAGIILGAKSYGSVHDNYINGGTGEGLEFYGYGGTTSIYNNTIINAGYDGTSAGQDGIAVDDRPDPNNQYTGMRVYIINNTVVNPARNAVHLYNSYGTMATGNKIYNNFLVKPNNKSIYDNPYTNIDGNTNVDTLNNVKTPVIANAYFVNAIANNFHLLANSPAIDKGLNASSYGVTKDYDGVSRPQGSAFDAGAFEYNFGTPPPNQPPIADAGSDKIITLPTNSVSLSGSGTDADGTISNYSWAKISGPSNGTIISTTSATTSVTSLVQGVYLFGLKVTDNQGATARDTVQVTVNMAANIPPVANAGADKIITLPANSVSVTGSGTDADGTVSTYLWTKISGPSAIITTATAATTSITSLAQGSYLFELEITDNQGATARDTMQIIVNVAGNIPPVADAGADQTIILPTNSVSVAGSGTDANGTVSSYLWTKISGPSTGTITNTTSATTSITSLVQGLYLFELKVIDDQGAAAKDTMQVTVNPAANIPPIADAGSDKIITLPTNSVSLTGSGTDADGTISNYSWAKISGPSNGTIISTTSASTSVTSLVQGVYLFGLKVTDNQGATARDTVQVTVNVAANIPPVANAGADKTITLPINSVSVAGSGTDADGTVSSYLWTKISGPSATITNATTATTSITSLVQGSYLFELKVTDNQGATATDTMVVNVNAAGNIPPIANAGADQTITLPINSVSVAGSGTDADGTISSYLWTKISGPFATITTAAAATTSITSLAQGSYLFELKVIDNQGATATDTMIINVNTAGNIPPVANAGADKTITLPINSVSVAGSGTDADGTVSSYLWTKISGPSTGTITNTTSATTSITSLVQGLYLFELKVIDNQGATARDTMKVMVNAVGNIPPVANAGADKTVILPVNSVPVTGSGTDADGTISSYLWTKISGPSATITTAAAATTSITSLVQGSYLFELKVTDNLGATARDTVQVTVNAAGNIPPVANAGVDKTITLPTNSVSVTGSGTDADGTVSSYLWTKISGPSATITTAAAATTSITSLIKGSYLFELKVTDNQGAGARDTMQVIVNAAGNIPPVADAGADKTITLPVNSVSVSGSGTDADGTITNYLWTKISGPSATITFATAATTSITSLVQGSYLFELKVTDNQGATASDTLVVTVNAAANIPPVANAGADKTIALPTDSVSVTGSATDADGMISNYLWTKISGPSTGTITSSSSTITPITSLVQGIYLFELKVTDNQGATASDTMKVIVNAAANIPPVADAGADKTITLPLNVVLLAGSGGDADGSVINYSWSKISGPTSYNIVNPASPVTDVSGLVAGIYLFELIVTDNKGDIGNDTVKVTVKSNVNVPPIANAGLDQTITLPEDSTTLAGNGMDADGSIQSYYWRQISGPSISGISFPDAAVTNVTNLIGGTYQFELLITDNSGAIAKDTLSVVVALPRLAVPNNRLKVYPNPVIDITTLEINTVKSNSPLLVVITDIQGRIVYKKELYSTQNFTVEKINVSNLIKGIYALTVYFNGTDKQTIKIFRSN